MAEKAEKKPEAAAPAAKGDDKKAAAPAPSPAPGKAAAASGGGGIGALLSKTPVLLAAVMIIEAVVLFAGMRFLGAGAHPAAAATTTGELTTEEPKADESSGEKGKEGAEGAAKKVDKKKPVEVSVIDFRAPNKLTGKTFIYDVSIYAVTKAEYSDRLTTILKDRDALVKDRIRTIIAQSDPEKLGGGSEPGLETLRRQVKYQLDEIVGDGMIDEVLVPRCMPFRADY